MTGLWTVICFVFASLALLLGQDGRYALWVTQRVWSPVLVWLPSAWVTVRGLENVDFTRPAVFVSNHQSTVDIPVLFMALPTNFRFVAKKIIRYIPFLGWFIWMAGFIFVDRKNHADAVRSLDAAAEQIRAGKSIVVFAEGTRSSTGEVLPFKKGPFALALKAGVPVVPVAVEGSGIVMPKNRWTFTSREILVAVGKPIDPAPFGTDKEALLAEVRSRIIDLNLSLGGKGGDKSANVAARGFEGIGKGAEPEANT